MALFKILRGDVNNLPKEMHDGWAYFTTDTHEFFIDYEDNNKQLQRASITAARTLPRLSSDGVYYFDTSVTPVTPSVILLSCGGAEEFVADIIYNAGNSTETEYEKILQSI